MVKTFCEDFDLPENLRVEARAVAEQRGWTVVAHTELIYSQRSKSPFHKRGVGTLDRLAGSARISAVCMANGVEEFWSVHRDLAGSPLRFVNPLADQQS